MHHRSITEALTQLIQQDDTIKGVEAGGIQLKISQFADDTTIIAKPTDLPRMQKHEDTWCEATGIKEIKNKREGLLLGRLNRFKDQTPQNIVTDWTPDGTSIRALGESAYPWETSSMKKNGGMEVLIPSLHHGTQPLAPSHPLRLATVLAVHNAHAREPPRRAR